MLTLQSMMTCQLGPLRHQSRPKLRQTYHMMVLQCHAVVVFGCSADSLFQSTPLDNQPAGKV